MKVGFDAKRIVRNGTGLGSYGRTLVNDLAVQCSLDLRLYAPDRGCDDLRKQVPESENLHYCYPEGRQWLGKAYWRSRGIVGQLVGDGVQVFHGLSGELPFGIRKSGIKSVVTIHDLIFMRHPEYYHWHDTQIYTRKFHHALREADCIVAISECTKRDIMELGGVDERRIRVVYQSCAPRFKAEDNVALLSAVRQKYRLPQRYILSVGSIEQRKNLLLAVRALRFLPDDIALVAVGRPTKYAQLLADEASCLGLIHRVCMLHGVPDEHLPALYLQAEAFVYPSRYEGFGIPIIEAVSMGLPVVACTGSCLEEAGGPDSLYVGPDDEEGMAHALRQVLAGADGREQRIALSRQYVRRFENTNAARQMHDVYLDLF